MNNYDLPAEVLTNKAFNRDFAAEYSKRDDKQARSFTITLLEKVMSVTRGTVGSPDASYVIRPCSKGNGRITLSTCINKYENNELESRTFKFLICAYDQASKKWIVTSKKGIPPKEKLEELIDEVIPEKNKLALEEGEFYNTQKTAVLLEMEKKPNYVTLENFKLDEEHYGKTT